MGCCCSSCKHPHIVLSQQEQEEAQSRREVRQAQEPQRSHNSIQSWQSQSSYGDDQPPPYEEGFASHSTSHQPERLPTQRTELPYAIPLASFQDDTSLLNTISKVHTANFEDYGLTQEQFLTFYYELDKRLSHQNNGQSGMLNNVMDILRDDRAAIGINQALPRVENFVDISNHDVFHPASLHVEVLGSEATKHKVAPSPALELDQTKTITKLSKIEERLARLTWKFERDLAEASDSEQREIRAKYDDKKSKLRRKANEVLAEWNHKTDTDLRPPLGSPGEEGPLWLVVSEHKRV